MADLFLAPTADIPKSHAKTSEHPPAHGRCPTCGTPILRGLRGGRLIVVEPQCTPLYVVIWDSGAALPRVEQSAGYPEHHCWGEPAGGEIRDAS